LGVSRFLLAMSLE